MSGAVLAPWPNRLADGRYRFGGEVHELPITEPATGCAAHGLIAGTRFALLRQGPAELELSATVEPRPGYPWRLRINVSFALTADGLAQEIRATNLSEDPAPVGLGAHPYLRAGDAGRGSIDGCFLELPADEVMLTSLPRMLPFRLVPVEREGRGFDFRRPRRIGDLSVNNAFTALRASTDGRLVARLLDAEGRGSEIEWDARTRWIQVYTADESTDEAHRDAVAVEPMTCAPDAFNSGTDLRVLARGETAGIGFILRAVG